MKFFKVFPEPWVVRLLAILTSIMGIINMISATQPAVSARIAILEQISPLEVAHGSRFTTSLAGFALLVLAANLWRRKKIAWRITLGTLIVTIITHLLKGLDYEEASLAAILLIVLILARHSFHAISDRPSVKFGLFVLGGSVAFTLIYGAVGLSFLDKHFNIHFNLLDALWNTLLMFVTFSDPGVPLTRFGRYFIDSIYMIGFSTLAFALFMLIRPVLVRSPSKPEEYQRAESVVKQYGRSALARPALFPDKSYFFSSGGCLINYSVGGRGCMVLGDPIGPADQIPDAILELRDFCSRNDWVPAFHSTLPDFLPSYRDAGFDSICLGNEAIVDLQSFTTEGSSNKAIRNTLSKMKRIGYQVEVIQPPISHQLLEELRDISDAWLTFHHGGEMHFSVGWFDDAYIRSCQIVLIRDANGSPIAFTNLVNEYQKNELSLDLMRYLPHVENGTMEFLFTAMLEYARDAGYSTCSLGVSAIVGVGEKPDDPRIEQALHTAAEYVSRFYNFKGLHNFKEKFHPNWEPRYIQYPGVINLPLILDSLLQVHSGKDYIINFLRPNR
jgi:phosphatidylglycerol lysyltransferase